MKESVIFHINNWSTGTLHLVFSVRLFMFPVFLSNESCLNVMYLTT